MTPLIAKSMLVNSVIYSSSSLNLTQGNSGVVNGPQLTVPSNTVFIGQMFFYSTTSLSYGLALSLEFNDSVYAVFQKHGGFAVGFRPGLMCPLYMSNNTGFGVVYQTSVGYSFAGGSGTYSGTLVVSGVTFLNRLS